MSGFTHGFHLRLDSSVACICLDQLCNKQRVKSSHKSARVNPRAVEEKLTKELRAKCMIGLFAQSVFSHHVVSPLGLREKKMPEKFRVIHDLSAPFGGSSVNSYIPTEAGTVSYDTVDTAIALIQSIGPGAVLAKSDIEHAYKLIRGDTPRGYSLLGHSMVWRLALGLHLTHGLKIRLCHLQGFL